MPLSTSHAAGDVILASDIDAIATQVNSNTVDIATNATAIALYERLGFQARGIRRGYYTDNREDALIMWKDPVGRDGN